MCGEEVEDLGYAGNAYAITLRNVVINLKKFGTLNNGNFYGEVGG